MAQTLWQCLPLTASVQAVSSVAMAQHHDTTPVLLANREESLDIKHCVDAEGTSESGKIQEIIVNCWPKALYHFKWCVMGVKEQGSA